LRRCRGGRHQEHDHQRHGRVEAVRMGLMFTSVLTG
jgi:hypothetical protein